VPEVSTPARAHLQEFNLTPSRQSALADGLYGLNSKNTEPRCDPHLLVEKSNGINKTSAMTIPRPVMVDRLKDD